MVMNVYGVVVLFGWMIKFIVVNIFIYLLGLRCENVWNYSVMKLLFYKIIFILCD